MLHRATVLALVVCAASFAGAGTPHPGAGPASAQADPVFVGAGDISTCANNNDELTATLLDNIDGAVYTLGDNAYDNGTANEFANCYDPTWGRHKARTRPAPGNHDYNTANATPYYDYFNGTGNFSGPAGDRDKGYYSYDLGAWHIIVINSNCGAIGGCQAGSPQEQWLRLDLALHPATCTLAYWHHPRFSSSAVHGNHASMEPVWQALYEYGADVVLSGHDHTYERFAPQDPGGSADPARGIREFVAGTGGRSHYSFATPEPNSEVRDAVTYGVLKLTLHPTSYDWEFVPEAGETFTDTGSDGCVSLSNAVGGFAGPPDVATPVDGKGWPLASAIAVAAAALIAALALGAGALWTRRRAR